MGEGTSLSARIRVAVWRARWVARVRRSGWPGPEPARMMRPFCVAGGGGAGREGEVVVVVRVVVEAREGEAEGADV